MSETTQIHLKATVAALLSPGKGILAADRSFPTIGKRFAALEIPSAEEPRRADRERLFTTPHLNEWISGERHAMEAGVFIRTRPAGYGDERMERAGGQFGRDAVRAAASRPVQRSRGVRKVFGRDGTRPRSRQITK